MFLVNHHDNSDAFFRVLGISTWQSFRLYGIIIIIFFWGGGYHGNIFEHLS